MKKILFILFLQLNLIIEASMTRKRTTPIPSPSTVKRERKSGQAAAAPPKKKLGNPMMVKGNSLWRRVDPVNYPKLEFGNPSILWDKAVEYFEWVESNPLYESKVVIEMGQAGLIQLPKMQAMTIGGLCLFLGISMNSYHEYRRNKGPGFSEVVAQIDSTIYHQKFTGAAAGLFHAGIITRDLGLVERQDVTSAGEQINNTPTVIILPPKKQLG